MRTICQARHPPPPHQVDALEDEVAPGKEELVTDTIEGDMLSLSRGPETLKLLVRLLV